MGRNPQISRARNCHISMKYLFLCLLVMHLEGRAFAVDVPGEDLSSFKVFKAFQVKEQEYQAALKRRTSVPLDASAQKCLEQLIAIEGTLDEVLSSQPYLVYLTERFGKVYENYSTYLAGMPTAHLKIEALFIFKEVLPSKQTPEELQAWIQYYFQMRRFYAIPDILNNRQKFMTEDVKISTELLQTLLRPPFERAAVKKILHISKFPQRIARMDTFVYHEVWQKKMKTHGSRKGLLWCAVATPDNFALTRAFFSNTETLKKWILEPLKKTSRPERKEK